MKKQLLIIGCLFVSSYAFANVETTKQQAVQEVTKSNNKELYFNYLQCYALDKNKKSTCIKNLSNKYILKSKQHNDEYVREFTYEAEKQGFAYFLKGHNKDCDKVDEGPLFNKDKSVYDVKCQNGKSFEMHFDYKNMVWFV